MAPRPYTTAVASSRRPLGVILRIVIAAYIAALAVLPLAHHDLACHLKSSTHCSSCHVGTCASAASLKAGVGQLALTDVGRARELEASRVTSCVLLPSTGRSPPTAKRVLL